MGLGCPEALKEGPHMGSMKGRAVSQEANCKHFSWSTTGQNLGQMERRSAQGEEKETFSLVWSLESWLVRIPIRFGSCVLFAEVLPMVHSLSLRPFPIVGSSLR